MVALIHSGLWEYDPSMTSKNSSQAQCAPLAGVAAHGLLNTSDKELRKFSESFYEDPEQAVESLDSKSPKKKK